MVPTGDDIPNPDLNVPVAFAQHEDESINITVNTAAMGSGSPRIRNTVTVAAHEKIKKLDMSKVHNRDSNL